MSTSIDTPESGELPTTRTRLFVSNSRESTRMFKHDWMEALSKVHWSVPAFVYLPIISGLLYYGYGVRQIAVLEMAAWFVSGVLSWTLVEYVMHRFIFHYHPKSSWGKRIHFIMHGVHHDYPNDMRRLVMPPSASLPIIALFYGIAWLALSSRAEVFIAGLLLGYVVYDMMHYALHHMNFRGGLLRTLKQHHMRHHYSDPDHGYGVSSRFWDGVLGTRFTRP